MTHTAAAGNNTVCSWKDRRVRRLIYVEENVFEGCELPQSLCQRRGGANLGDTLAAFGPGNNYLLWDWSRHEIPGGGPPAAGWDWSRWECVSHGPAVSHSPPVPCRSPQLVSGKTVCVGRRWAALSVLPETGRRRRLTPGAGTQTYLWKYVARVWKGRGTLRELPVILCSLIPV